MYTLTLGEKKYKIDFTALRCGEDLVVTISGGEKPHIGAVSLAVYEPERDSATVSTITVYSHRDDVCAQTCAKMLSKELKCTVTCSVGVHIDNAKPIELKILFDICIEGCRKIIEHESADAGEDNLN